LSHYAASTPRPTPRGSIDPGRPAVIGHRHASRRRPPLRRRHAHSQPRRHRRRVLVHSLGDLGDRPALVEGAWTGPCASQLSIGRFRSGGGRSYVRRWSVHCVRMPCAALRTSDAARKPAANPLLSGRTRRATLPRRALCSLEKAPRKTPEKPAPPTTAGTRNRWSGACTPARGSRSTSGR